MQAKILLPAKKMFMPSPILLSQNPALPAEGLERNPLLEYRAALPKKPRRQHQEPEVAKLLNELRQWCEQEHGRQTEVAKILGVDHRRLYDWFSGRISPTLAVGLRAQAFLAAQKRQRRRPGAEGGDKP